MTGPEKIPLAGAVARDRSNPDNAPCRTIYLARHGAIQEPGPKKYFIGRSDFSLSSKGHKQAAGLAEQLRNIPLTAIYTSDLVRTVETARYTADIHGLSPIRMAGLREIDLGRWEGLSFESVQQNQPELFAQRGRHMVHFRPPEGESFMDLALRVIPALYHIVNSTRGNILIVAHAGVNRIILSQALGANLADLFNIRIDYAAIYRIAVHHHRFTVPYI